jgi:hypothetical protein
MLREGHVLRVPVTQDGQDEVLTVLVDRVDGSECHISGDHGGFWVPEALLFEALARAEIAIDPGQLTPTMDAHAPA